MKSEAKILKYFDSITTSRRCFPVSLHVEITDNCFNRCPMCGHWKRPVKTDLDIKSLNSFLEYGQPLGLETVCLTGGDPFAREDINEVMLMVSRFADFGIVTAGHLPDYVSTDILRKARWMRVSLDAVDETVYGKVRGGQLSSEKVKEGIERAVQDGVNVELGITIHKLNISDLVNTFRYARRIGIKNISARTVYSHSNAMMLSRIELKSAVFACRSYSVNFTDNYKPKPTVRCWAAKYQHFIRANGDVYPCCIIAGDTEVNPKAGSEAILGNIISDNYCYLDIWDSVEKFTHNVSHYPMIEVCNSDCIKRLNSINTITEHRLNERTFF